MKATLHLHGIHTPTGKDYHLRRTLDDAPHSLVPGVDIALMIGGPLQPIHRSTFCPTTRSFSIHLEHRPLFGGIGGLTLEDLIEAGWEVAK